MHHLVVEERHRGPAASHSRADGRRYRSRHNRPARRLKAPTPAAAPGTPAASPPRTSSPARRRQSTGLRRLLAGAAQAARPPYARRRLRGQPVTRRTSASRERLTVISTGVPRRRGSWPAPAASEPLAAHAPGTRSGAAAAVRRACATAVQRRRPRDRHQLRRHRARPATCWRRHLQGTPFRPDDRPGGQLAERAGTAAAAGRAALPRRRPAGRAAAARQRHNTARNLPLDLLGGPTAVTAFAPGLDDATTRFDRNEPQLNVSTGPDDERDTTTPTAIVESMRAVPSVAACSRPAASGSPPRSSRTPPATPPSGPACQPGG
ncbi:hypothetical protein SVIOM342S_04075 [Streptomyces violaceorubidus]